MNEPSTQNPAGSPDHKSFGFWATLGILLGIIILWMILQVATELLCGLAANSMAPGIASTPASGFTSISLSAIYILPGFIALSLVFVFCKIKNPSIPEYLALRRLKFTKYIPWVLIFALFAVALDRFCHGTGRLLGPEILYQAVGSGRYQPLLFTAVLLAAPVVEEVLFRGFAYRGLASTRFGPTPAIFITSLIWALIHAFQYDAVLLALIFVAGIVLGIVRMRLKSVYPTIVMHSVMNLIAMVQITWAVS